MELELERLKKQIDLLEKAYFSIESGLSNNLNDLEKDGIIQRFEYTIELSWKTCKKFLEYGKFDFISAPRDIFKECFKISIIKDLELWLNFLDIRNSMSHMYSEYISGKSFDYISKNHKKIGLLINNLKQSTK